MRITKSRRIGELNPDQPEKSGGGAPALGIYGPGFRYKKESMQFFKSCVGEDTYWKAMNSDAGRAH